MPSRVCDICRRQVTVDQKKWGYINYPGTFVCSATCVFTWIFKHPMTETPEWLVHAHPVRGYTRTPAFKSYFEERVSYSFTKRKLFWRYEEIGFAVGDSKIYIPDFLLVDRWCLIETKGRWGLGQKAKMELFMEQYPDIPLLVIPWIIQREFENADQPRLHVW